LHVITDKMPRTVENFRRELFMRRTFRPTLIFLFLAFIATAPAAPQGEQKKEELPHPKTLEEVQKAMKDVVEKHHVTGAGVALVSNGQVLWCGGIGRADLTANRDIQCDTEFRVGSISKSFVALALLKLQEEGKINLYARLHDVAPEIPLKDRWESSNPVRIVNLLEHTAGFDDMAPSEVYNRHDRQIFRCSTFSSVFKNRRMSAGRRALGLLTRIQATELRAT